jgi:diaminopimelate decarboxylase
MAPSKETKSKSLPWSDSEIIDLCHRLPTPFHIYHEQSIRETVRGLNKAFAWCPGFKNHFAVKATPNPYLLRLLREEGCGTDCSSISELLLSETTGFQGDEIMFTSNNTPLKEYRKALKLGAIVNLDDITHVDFLHREAGLPELISFRYNPGPERTGNVLIGDPKEAKFGFTRPQLFEAYKRCKDLGVRRFALHAMVVSCCLDPKELVETARMLFNIVREVHDKLGIRIEMVNLGGGIGIPYKPEESTIDVQQVGSGIHAVYREIIETAGLAPLRVVMECGRYITGPHGFLFTRATHQKRTYKNYVGVDACMANLMRPGMYNAYHHISVVPDPSPPGGLPQRDAQLPNNKAELTKNVAGMFDVVGGLCENNDKFAVDRLLNPYPVTGDILVIHDSRAHGHSMGFNYNGKPRSAEYLYRAKGDGSTLCIRRAETYEDLQITLDLVDAASWGGGPVARVKSKLQAFAGSQTAFALAAAALGAVAATAAMRIMRR